MKIKESSVRYLYAILTLVLVLTFLSTMGCGYRTALRNHCHLDTQTCDNLFGENTWDMDDRLVAVERNIEEISKEITSLQTMTQLLISESQDKSAEIAQLQALMQLIQNTVTNNATFVQTVTADLQAQIDSLESSITGHGSGIHRPLWNFSRFV
jgi:peptidoglycan hydrolase CwlO-like protein